MTARPRRNKKGGEAGLREKLLGDARDRSEMKDVAQRKRTESYGSTGSGSNNASPGGGRSRDPSVASALEQAGKTLDSNRHNIVYALVARGEALLAEYLTPSSGLHAMVKIVNESLLRKIPPRDMKQSLNITGITDYSFHFEVDTGVTYLCMADDRTLQGGRPKLTVMFEFLHEAKVRFLDVVGIEKAITADGIPKAASLAANPQKCIVSATAEFGAKALGDGVGAVLGGGAGAIAGGVGAGVGTVLGVAGAGVGAVVGGVGAGLGAVAGGVGRRISTVTGAPVLAGGFSSGADKWEGGDADPLCFRTHLRELVLEANTSKTKIDQVKDQAKDATEYLKGNVEKALERGEKIEVLVVKADKLQMDAFKFEHLAKKVKKKYWWQNFKMKVCLASCCLIIIGLIILAVLEWIPHGSSNNRG